MSDKTTWLTMLDKRIRRERNLSILVKVGSLFVLYFLMQVLNVSVAFGIFSLCLVIMAYFLDVLVNQKAREYTMLYEQARTTSSSDVSMILEPQFNKKGKKNGKADFWSVCADWRVYLFYAFFFVMNLALLITVAVMQNRGY